MIDIPVNKFQTPITEELLGAYPQEVQESFIDMMQNIPFLRNLASPNRQYAKDRPRDEQGRIIVDLENPHILENMDYFREPALTFKRTGMYTTLRPNANQNSDYGKWIREEKRRCWEGYVRKEDGEWVTGYLYWYLNYCPIMQSEIRKGTKRADRVEDLPESWEGVYWRFHYIEQAANNGKHCAELASRGKSKSYSLASILSHIFILGENTEAHEKVKGIVTAYSKEFLTKDGVLNKFVDMANFCAKTTQFPRKKLKNSMQEMTWVMGYKDVDLDIDRGTQNTVIGVACQDDESKLRGKRAAKILIEEFGSFPKLLELYNTIRPSVEEGNIVFGQIIMVGTAGDEDSDFRGAQEIVYNPMGYNMYALHNVFDKPNQGKPYFVFFFPGYVNRKGCYNEDGVSDVVKGLLEILNNRYNVKYNSTDPNTIIKTIAEVPITPAEAITKVKTNMFPVADLTERVAQIDSDPSILNNVYVGRLEQGKDGAVSFKPTGDEAIRDFPHKNNKIEGAVEIMAMPEIDKKTNKAFENRYILGCLKKGEKVNTDKGLKNVEDVTLDDMLINIDGKSVIIKNLQKYHNEDPVYKVKLASIYDTTTFSKEHPIYSCTPKRRYNNYRKVKTGLPERYYDYDFQFNKVSELKVGDYVKTPIPYRCEMDMNEYKETDIWYLIGVMLGDGWIEKDYSIHIAFNAKETYLIDRCGYIVNKYFDRRFTKSKDKGTCYEYSFCNKKFALFFNENFGKYAGFKHIEEKVKKIPFAYRKNLILGYIDTDGCVTRNSINIVSISKRLLNDIQDWFFSLGIVSSIKKLRDEEIQIIRNAEVHTKKTYQLNVGTEGLNKIKDWEYTGMKLLNYEKVEITNHNRNDVFVKSGYIYLKVKQIEKEDYIGDVYNFECDTHTFMCNYIPTHNCDPYDDDQSNTMSLGSIFVLDLWKDELVAEYTGRPLYADDFFEICRRMCLFYNGRLNYEYNKKGLFAYFSSRNCVYLLTEVLDFLKDKQLMKDGYGNKSRGTNATAAINAYGKSRLRAWLMGPVITQQKVDGKITDVTVSRLFQVKNRALLKELIQYNTEGNFDRISAMGMLMLLREDKMILYQNNINQDDIEKANKDYAGNDSFFNKNYDKKFNNFNKWI